MVASLGVGISFSLNGKKHTLDPGLQPCTTLYDFLRGRTTYTASSIFSICTRQGYIVPRPLTPRHVSWHVDV